jgi:hypothetical protein
MRYAIAVLFAMSSASAMAGSEAPNVSDEQMACAGAAAQEYETANAALAQRATADGSMSVEDTIAQRRLVEDFCKRWAACLVNAGRPFCCPATRLVSLLRLEPPQSSL